MFVFAFFLVQTWSDPENRDDRSPENRADRNPETRIHQNSQARDHQHQGPAYRDDYGWSVVYICMSTVMFQFFICFCQTSVACFAGVQMSCEGSVMKQ